MKLFFFTALLSFGVVTAQAQDALNVAGLAQGDEIQALTVDAWQADVGAVVISKPTYVGADDQETILVPLVDVKYQDKFFASVARGVGYNVINDGRWRAGPVANYNFGRDEDDAEDGDLSGVGDVDDTVEVGGFIEYKYGPDKANLRTRLEVRQGIGGHEGLVGQLSSSFSQGFGPYHAFYAVAPNIKFGDADYTNAFFGIDSGQAAASNFNQFDADGGINSVGISGVVVHPISQNWGVTGFAAYDRLVGDVADSPIVEAGSNNVITVGIGLARRFTWGGEW